MRFLYVILIRRRVDKKDCEMRKINGDSQSHKYLFIFLFAVATFDAVKCLRERLPSICCVCVCACVHGAVAFLQIFRTN